MQLTTTSSIEGRTIRSYCGIVSGEAILGAEYFRGTLWFPWQYRWVLKLDSLVERRLPRVRELALATLTIRAKELGADAVIGLNFQYQMMSPRHGLLLVCASGTAVVLS
jgi:uncharacterized protein YbjQ (UPF0145 family)